MSFAVTFDATRLIRLPILACMFLLASCSNEASKEGLRILGTPPENAVIGTEYSYDFGVDGGEGILNYSLSNAPRWLTAELVQNDARKGVVIRGVPGVTGGAQGVGGSNIVGLNSVTLNVYDNNSSASVEFPVNVVSNTLTVPPVTVKEGAPTEEPKDASGNPVTECVIRQPGSTGGTGRTSAFVAILLGNPSVRTVVANFRFTTDPTVNNSAAEGIDYLNHTGQVIFNPGQTVCYVEVVILDDFDAESSERITFDLDIVEGLVNLDEAGNIRDVTAAVTIEDNEPSASFDQNSVVVSEGGEALVGLTLDKAVEREDGAYLSFKVAKDDNAILTPSQYSFLDVEETTDTDGSTLYRLFFAKGEEKKSFRVKANSLAALTSPVDLSLDLALVSTGTVHGESNGLRVFFNQWLQPTFDSLGADGKVRELVADRYSSVYVAYSALNPATNATFGAVKIYDRFGQLTGQAIPFARAGNAAFNHSLADAFLLDYNSTGSGNVQDRIQELYLVGSTEGNTGATSAGGKDGLIELWRKVNDGPYQLVWFRQFGTAFDDRPNSVFVDQTFNIYVAGETDGAFEGSRYGGQTDAFLAKFDSAGQLLFVVNYGTAGRDSFVEATGTTSQQGVSLVGTTTADFGIDIPKGGIDFIVGSYNREGQVRRLNQFGGLLDNIATSISMSDREIIVGGYTKESLNNSALLAGEDAFLAYMRNASAIEFIYEFGTAGDDRVNKVITVGDKVFATGYVSGQLNSEHAYGGARDAFLGRFSIVDDKLEAVEIRAEGTAEDDQGAGLAFTPSQKLMWLTEFPDTADTVIQIRPYNEFGKSLLQ